MKSLVNLDYNSIKTFFLFSEKQSSDNEYYYEVYSEVTQEMKLSSNLKAPNVISFNSSLINNVKALFSVETKKFFILIDDEIVGNFIGNHDALFEYSEQISDMFNKSNLIKNYAFLLKQISYAIEEIESEEIDSFVSNLKSNYVHYTYA
jgi:hypothetical protein